MFQRKGIDSSLVNSIGARIPCVLDNKLCMGVELCAVETKCLKDSCVFNWTFC